WSMVALSLLVYLPTLVVTVFGVALIGLHNLLDGLNPADVPLPGWLWTILHSPGEATVVEGYTFGTGYCLIPWIGVMAAGCGFGRLWLLERSVRRRWFAGIGIAITLGYFLVRGSNIYGDPIPWSSQATPFLTGLSCLNCCKYP